MRTFVSYSSPGESFLEHPAVEDALPDMSLFPSADRYVNVPLEPSYRHAWSGTPDIWREVLEPPA